MKKKLALVLSLIVLLTLAIPTGAFAESFDKGLENAIKIAKTKFTIPEDFKFDNSISTEESKKVFRLTWTSAGEKDETYNVTIDENGTVTNYNHYAADDYIGQSKLPKYSKSEAKAFADKFLSNVAPELVQKLKYDESFNNNSTLMDYFYNATYVRVENGVPLHNDQASFSVNRNTGEVSSYYLRWTDGLTFSDPTKAISSAKAQEAYVNNLGLRLIYKYSYENNKLTLYPVYVPKYSSNFAVDALTGKKIEINNNNYGPYYGVSATVEKAAGMAFNTDQKADVVLSKEEQNAVAEASKLISLEKAENYARALKYIDLTGYKMSYSNLSKTWPMNDSFIWQLNFTKEATKTSSYSYATVTVDAVTGAIRNFSADRKYVEGEKGKVSAADAKKAADKFISEFKKDIYGQLVYDESYNTDYSKLKDIPVVYYFTYVRKVGNALFPDNMVTVSYDAVNNKVLSFDLNWFNTNFPSVANVISLDTANKALFEKVGLELQYSMQYPDTNNGKVIVTNPQGTKPQALLVYTLKPDKPAFIDANTAGLLDYNGKPYKENKIASYTDIAGNAAENAIKALAEYGISLEGTEFKPAEAIVQKDFFILLSKALGYNDGNLGAAPTDKAINDMYTYLIRSGVVKAAEKSVSSRVTREDAVKFIIRAMNYSKVADLKDMFVCSFADKSSITPELVGYVTLAGNLKLIEYGNINFGPKTEMTRAETATLIYKYLQL